MNTRIQLQHPAGKKVVSMNKRKYDTLRNILLNRLKTGDQLSHAEILETITQEFRKNNTRFEGSIGWHMEWVKLDMEARGEITRVAGKSANRFVLAA